MDKDTEMLQRMGNAVTALQIKYRSSNLTDRMMLKPALVELMNDYAAYQIKLLKEGIITGDEDLREMEQIAQEIENAAEKEMMLRAIAKTIAFVALRV